MLLHVGLSRMLRARRASPSRLLFEVSRSLLQTIYFIRQTLLVLTYPGMVLWHPRASWGLRNLLVKKSGQKAPNKRQTPLLVSRLRDIHQNIIVM